VRAFDLAQYMRLDGAALKALNLVATADDVNQRLNLATHLDATARPQMGSRLLHQLVKQPLLDAARIAERQDLVAAFFEDTLLRQHVRDDGLRGMPDVERLCRKLVLGRAGLQDLCVLYQFRGAPARRRAAPEGAPRRVRGAARARVRAPSSTRAPRSSPSTAG
jgi:DNA mismatch repair protein MSH2